MIKGYALLPIVTGPVAILTRVVLAGVCPDIGILYEFRTMGLS